ncbi:MAG: hypothetical protein V3W14_00050 [Candidatus Neomarinimicrobiota bacterium]
MQENNGDYKGFGQYMHQAWEGHLVVVVAALNRGKHVLVEAVGYHRGRRLRDH